MAVSQRFVFEWPDGVTPVLFMNWIKLLSESEQDEFNQAKIRQEAHRQQAIDDQRMTMVKDAYVWKNQIESKKKKPSDPVWVEYFERYLQETQTQFKMVYEEVVETVG
jgi:hypothetical protein